VRWPYWAESNYNAIYSQTISGSDGAFCYFYGGMPSDPNGNPPQRHHLEFLTVERDRRAGRWSPRRR